MNKMKVKVFSFLLALTCVIAFYSCEDDGIAQSNAKVSFKNPEGLENVVIKNMEITLTERNTGATHVNTVTNGVIDTVAGVIPQGLYDIYADGIISYNIDGEVIEGKVKGFGEGISVSGSIFKTSINLFLYDVESGLIFEELFTVGTQGTDGKYYRGDSYFKIYNNSDETIYADGYVIAESKFVTTTKQDYTPDIMNDAFAAIAIYMIPGNGTNIPIEPGKSIIIADQAINHLEKNPNSIDLSKANFEWYDETSQNLDIDNPAVPNLIRIYAETKTSWNPNIQTNRAYVLAKLGTDVNNYLANYKYDYTYEGTVRTMTGSVYKIPNQWIKDAVNTSVKSDFEWIVTTPSLDMGWSYCRTSSDDETRWGKSMQRKVLSVTENGHNILQDTNNSTTDFICKTKTSLIK